MEDANHLLPINHQHGGLCGAGGGPHSNGLTCETAFAKEIAGPEIGQDRFFATLIDYGELYASLLDVHDVRSGIPLPENGCFLGIFNNFSLDAGRIEEGLRVKSERQSRLGFSVQCRLWHDS